MKERVLAKIRTSATPPVATQASSPLLHQRPLTDELSESVGSNSNISKELGGIQPKTIRRSLNWQNITVEAPSRGNGMSLPGGIQRQQEEPGAVSGERVSADSVQKSPLESSNSTISTDLAAQKPLIARAPFNGRNIPVEAPSRGNGMSLPGGIQRQQEEPGVVIGDRVSADSLQKSPLESSNSTISTDLAAQKPLIARAPFNGRNIPVEAPPRSSAFNTYPGGIQRLETSGVKEPEESIESLQMQPQGAIQAKSSSGEPQEKEEQNKEIVQAKLTVSTPGDKYEEEADATAAKIMAMPDPVIEPQQLASKQPNPTTPGVQRSAQEDKTVSPELENRIQNAKGGSPLPDSVRAFMEPRFGVDFSQIQVHTDSNAAAMCKEVGAKAFAVGNRVYYGAGYAPGNNELTAHELTHTIQQGATKRLNKEIRQLPEPSESLVAKKITTTPPHHNKQLRQFPLAESSSDSLKADSSNLTKPNQIERQVALDEIPGSTLTAKQFTPDNTLANFNRIGPHISEKLTPTSTLTAKQFTPDNTPENFNKIQPHISEKLTPTDSLQAKSFPQTASENQPLSVSKTKPQIQGNWLKERAIQAFEGLMKTRGGPAATQVIAVLRRAGNTFSAIVTNPKGFLTNLVNALQTGFKQFSSKIVNHLKNGLAAWLTGSLSATGLSVPDKLDARGIVSLALSVLGINYGRVRNILVKRIGGGKVKQLEGGFDLVQRLANGGLAAAVQHMMHVGKTLQQLQTTVIESVRNWVIETVVKAAISKLVATFSGFGAIAVAAQGIYNAIAFLIEQANKIQALVNAVAASIGNIVAGKVSEAANYIESTLARSLSVAISFLARIVGLGNVGQKVREIIGRVQSRVDVAVNKLVDLVAKQGNDWLAKAGGGRPSNAAGGSNKPGSQRPVPPNRTRQPPVQRRQQIGDFTVKHPFTMSGEKHHLIGIFSKGRLNMLIASNPEDFKGAVQRAITEVPRSRLTQVDQKLAIQILKNTLDTIENIKHDVILNEGEIIKGSPIGGEAERKRQYTLRRLAQLANVLQEMAQRWGIKSLDDFYKAPPKHRYLPGYPKQSEVGEFIREKLYERLGWDPVRDAIVNKERPNLVARVRDVQKRGDQKMWGKLIREGIVEPSASIKSYDPSPNKVKYHVDHVKPLAAHWSDTGYNSDDAERYKGLTDSNNLRLVTAKYNLSKNSNTANSGRVNYRMFVGPEFTSDLAEGGIKGALKIDKEPFLDADGKPLV